MARRVSVLCSGGVDSVFLAQEAHDDPEIELHSLIYIVTDIPALAEEVRAVESTAARLEVPLCMIDAALDTRIMRRGNNARVVPGRNLAFLALAVNAVSHDVDAIWIGCTADDDADYPDCRQDFLQDVSDLCSMFYSVEIEAPFVHKTKHGILAERLMNHQDPRAVMHLLDRCWSCYAPSDSETDLGVVPCGQCNSCLERQGAVLKFLERNVNLHFLALSLEEFEGHLDA
jgi:7-cyano-7-deazaguanine synthase in queuosine biosynthesis